MINEVLFYRGRILRSDFLMEDADTEEPIKTDNIDDDVKAFLASKDADAKTRIGQLNQMFKASDIDTMKAAFRSPDIIKQIQKAAEEARDSVQKVGQEQQQALQTSADTLRKEQEKTAADAIKGIKDEGKKQNTSLKKTAKKFKNEKPTDADSTEVSNDLSQGNQLQDTEKKLDGGKPKGDNAQLGNDTLWPKC